MKLKRCPKCGKYNLKEKCCTKTVTAHPPKFSLDKEIKYGKYRRKGKSN